MSSRHTKRAAETGARLALLIAALEEEDTLERPGEAQALRAFGELALRQVPARGVFAPAHGALYVAIDQVARKHLALAAPHKAFVDATSRLEPFALRDEVEMAVNHLMTVSDRAYYYAGLAFGVTLIDFRALP